MLVKDRRFRIGSNWAQVYIRPARVGSDGISFRPAFRIKYRGLDVEGATEQKALSSLLSKVGVRTRPRS